MDTQRQLELGNKLYCTFSVKSDLDETIETIKSNYDILEINNDPVSKYASISSIQVPKTQCINLALEDNHVNRVNQITNKNKFNSKDCINIRNENYDNIEENYPKNTIIENIQQLIGYTPSSTHNNSNIKNEYNNTTIVDVHEYNRFYVYGLTSMNCFLLLIVILMVIVIYDDNAKHLKTQK